MSVMIASPGHAQRTTGGALRVPWTTVIAFAVVFAYADDFWIVALRGAVGSISRTDAPFTTWLRESTLVVPLYVFAVLAALTLALRWFGPHPRRGRAVATVFPLVVAAATLLALALLVASAVSDYHLQTAELQAVSATHGNCDADCLDRRQEATLDLHLRAVALGSLLLLWSNFLLGGLVVAFRGGRIDVASSRPPVRRLLTWGSRADQGRTLVAAALIGAAVIHGLVSADRFGTWPGAVTFFGMLSAAEIVVAILVAARRRRGVAVAAAALSAVGLLLWVWTRTIGLPFGQQAGAAEPLGVVDTCAAVLYATTLAAALALVRARDSRRRAELSHHLHRLALVAVGALVVLALGSGLGPLGAPTDVNEPAPHAHST
jgi:hypothetical protein